MKKSLAACLFSLIAFAALPNLSSATPSCRPGQCYSSSWGGCINCKYIKNDKAVSLSIRSTEGSIKTIKGQIKRLQAALASKTKTLAKLNRAKKINTANAKRSRRAPLKKR